MDALSRSLDEEFTVLKPGFDDGNAINDGAELDMTANTSSLTGTIFATIAALLAGADCTSGAEQLAKGDSSYCLENPCPPDSRPREFGFGTSTTLSNDRTSRYVPLVQHKSIALDLARDVSDVFIADPKTANIVLRSKRRAFVVAMAPGQTRTYLKIAVPSRSAIKGR